MPQICGSVETETLIDGKSIHDFPPYLLKFFSESYGDIERKVIDATSKYIVLLVPMPTNLEAVFRSSLIDKTFLELAQFQYNKGFGAGHFTLQMTRTDDYTYAQQQFGMIRKVFSEFKYDLAVAPVGKSGFQIAIRALNGSRLVFRMFTKHTLKQIQELNGESLGKDKLEEVFGDAHSHFKQPEPINPESDENIKQGFSKEFTYEQNEPFQFSHMGIGPGIDRNNIIKLCKNLYDRELFTFYIVLISTAESKSGLYPAKIHKKEKVNSPSESGKLDSCTSIPEPNEAEPAGFFEV